MYHFWCVQQNLFNSNLSSAPLCQALGWGLETLRGMSYSCWLWRDDCLLGVNSSTGCLEEVVASARLEGRGGVVPSEGVRGLCLGELGSPKDTAFTGRPVLWVLSPPMAADCRLQTWPTVSSLDRTEPPPSLGSGPGGQETRVPAPALLHACV